MIRLIEISNFRMLARNRVALSKFHVLVGQNATGKTTFMDVFQFISDVLRNGVREAVESRAPSFFDLCFDPKSPVSFAVEVVLKEPREPSSVLRYELEVGLEDPANGGLRVLREFLYKLPADRVVDDQPSLFGPGWDDEILHEKTPKKWRRIVRKTPEGRDYFQDEKTSWNNVFRFGVDKAALGSLPDDPDRFPLSIAVRDLLRDGVQTLALDARQMRLSAPPGGGTRMELDGSNLPYVARDLSERDPVLFREWVRHLQTGVVGLEEVSVREREEDRHLVLQASFSGRHFRPVPSWLLSDGTLRLMALTLLSYSARPEDRGVLLIEEPENGLHPLAIQAAFEALSDPTSDLQIFCATHSPIFLAHVRMAQALVFRRHGEGHATVRHGPEVPELAEWTQRRNLADLLATGVLA